MKQTVIGTKNMVVSPHYLASMAGARILQQGGNAFDAAVAVSACLAVVYPHMTGVGGDSFWLTYNRQEKAVRAYNATGRSGYKATREAFQDVTAIPQRGVRAAITVPGMVDGWDAILRQYGRLTLADVLEPAIRYAEEGFPLSPSQHENTVSRFSVLAGMPNTSEVYTPGGLIPPAGSRFVQKQLGQSLKHIAAFGREGFYKGGLAKSITSYLQANGGLLNEDDFADHTGNWVEPATGSYRGLDLYQLPPNSQGFTGIMTAQILEAFDFSQIEHGSYEYYHLLVEALKQSFSDRNRFLTDPEFSKIPLDRLLSKTYCQELSARIQMNKALPLSNESVGGDTAYAAVVDEEGNAVSFIQSLYFEFGSAVSAGDTGILLQNRGSFFSLDPNPVNTLEPHKRTFHTLMPAMALRNGSPYLVYGTMGGEGQPQTQTALLTRMVDYGMDPQSAVNAPRWVWGRTWGESTEELKIEGRVPDAVIRKLLEAGHLVNLVNDYDSVVGHAHAIIIDEQGFRLGGTDPRADGLAVGW